jgi:hypothetical protein
VNLPPAANEKRRRTLERWLREGAAARQRRIIDRRKEKQDQEDRQRQKQKDLDDTR